MLAILCVVTQLNQDRESFPAWRSERLHGDQGTTTPLEYVRRAVMTAETLLAEAGSAPQVAAQHESWHGQTAIHLLNRLANSWEDRAQVKKPEPAVDSLFDPSKPDYLVGLLPFADHPDFLQANEQLRQQVLSCGWLAYNEKTVAVESKIVSPACMYVIDGDFPKLRGETYRQTASQALVDESYHILLIVNACRVTRLQRDLVELELPQFELVRRMREFQEQYPEPWQRKLIQLAWAVVSEVLVSDYLRLLSNSTEIQPINALATEIHRRDEAAHNAVFKTIGAALFHSLSEQEQRFFVSMLEAPAAAFADAELNVWQTMLEQIGFPNAGRMIADCRDAAKRVELDLSSLDALYADLDIAGNLWTNAAPGR